MLNNREPFFFFQFFFFQKSPYSSDLHCSQTTMDAARSCQWILIGILLVVSSNRATSSRAGSIQGSSLGRSKTIFDPGYMEASRGNDGNRTELTVNSPRRRRYVRFPTGPAGYLFEGGGGPPIGRNLGGLYPGGVPRFPSWRQHKSIWRSPISEYNRPPVMGHRTPRLIFRDNDFPPPVGGSAPSSFFQQSNHLPDFEDDARGMSCVSLAGGNERLHDFVRRKLINFLESFL